MTAASRAAVTRSTTSALPLPAGAREGITEQGARRQKLGRGSHGPLQRGHGVVKPALAAVGEPHPDQRHGSRLTSSMTRFAWAMASSNRPPMRRTRARVDSTTLDSGSCRRAHHGLRGPRPWADLGEILRGQHLPVSSSGSVPARAENVVLPWPSPTSSWPQSAPAPCRLPAGWESSCRARSAASSASGSVLPGGASTHTGSRSVTLRPATRTRRGVAGSRSIARRKYSRLRCTACGVKRFSR